MQLCIHIRCSPESSVAERCLCKTLSGCAALPDSGCKTWERGDHRLIERHLIIGRCESSTFAVRAVSDSKSAGPELLQS